MISISRKLCQREISSPGSLPWCTRDILYQKILQSNKSVNISWPDKPIISARLRSGQRAELRMPQLVPWARGPRITSLWPSTRDSLDTGLLLPGLWPNTQHWHWNWEIVEHEEAGKRKRIMWQTHGCNTISYWSWFITNLFIGCLNCLVWFYASDCNTISYWLLFITTLFIGWWFHLVWFFRK